MPTLKFWGTFRLDERGDGEREKMKQTKWTEKKDKRG